MKPRRISSAIVAANPKKPESEAIQRQVENFLLDHGVRLSKSKADVLITIGGDGTVLYNKEFSSLPLFGIGSRRSFICQATSEDWPERLGKALANGFIPTPRAMLSCRMNGKKIEDALNEFVVRSSGHRVLRIELEVQNKKVFFRADGIIFSTPTGSTAYAYSSGGVELPASSASYEIVSIAPYRRDFEYMVLGDSVAASAVIESETPAFIAVDGQFIHFFQGKLRLGVRKSARKTLFAVPASA